MPRSPGLRCALDVPALRIRSRLTPARLANGKIVMVNRGFVPERRTLPDNYLQYALTWYGLAGVLVISGLLAPGRSQAAVSPLRTKTPGKSVAYIKTQ